MGNKEAPIVNRQLNETFDRYNTSRDDFQDRVTGGLEGAQGRSDETYGAAFSGYQDLLDSLNNGGGGGGGGGGEFSEALSGFQEFADTGGIDADSMDRYRARGLYDELIKTGGYSDEDRRNVRSRGSSGIPAYYAMMQEEAKRMGGLQGGYNTGLNSQLARSGREGARLGAEAVRDTEIGLQDSIRTGRLQGGMAGSQAESALQGLLTGNKLAGLGGIAGIGSARSAAGSAAASRELQGKLAALGGISNLRGQTPGEVGMYLGAGLENMSAGQFGANQTMGLRAQYNPNVSGWDRAMQLVGAAAPIVSAFAGGGGGGGTPPGITGGVPDYITNSQYQSYYNPPR